MKFMKNLMKKIGMLALVGVIVLSGAEVTDGIATCAESSPNPYIEITSIKDFHDIHSHNIA